MPRLAIAVLLAPLAGALASMLFGAARIFGHPHDSISEKLMVFSFGLVFMAMMWCALLTAVLIPVHLAFRRLKIRNLFAYQVSFAVFAPLLWNLIFPIPRSFGELGIGPSIIDWIKFALAAVAVASLFWFLVVRPGTTPGRG